MSFLKPKKESKSWYYRRLWGTASIALGSYLLIEHVYQWGFQGFDIIGHEWLGILLVIIGSIITLRWDKK